MVAICPSVRPTDRRTPSVYLPRNFSRYQVRRGFASPSPGEAASHSGKRELPSLTPSLARSLAPGQSLGAQLKLDESWKLHGLHLINDAARPPQCTHSLAPKHTLHCNFGREGASPIWSRRNCGLSRRGNQMMKAKQPAAAAALALGYDCYEKVKAGDRKGVITT